MFGVLLNHCLLKIVEINSEANQREELSKWFIKYLNRQGDWLEKTRGNLMVAATVIAGMSFQVMVNPPSGVWQSDICSPGHQTGVCKAKVWGAIVQTSKRGFYHGMVTSTTISFSASMTQILLIISGLRLRNRLIMAILVTFMTVAVLCISAAFYCAVLVQSDDQVITRILKIYLGIWIVFFICILLIQLIRLHVG
ncbi:BnaA08g20860D [Brassica napus]|uniref:(rape) hypothetical protein n=2 Tax=Brassica TaxID=3705 RepID=A0A078HVV7_BRANA|nr:unnamed protein product [Brassica napus]CDY41484.1 BnaA08g20860D [Brassica napus]